MKSTGFSFVLCFLYWIQHVVASCDQYASTPDAACMLQDGISKHVSLGAHEKKAFFYFSIDSQELASITKKELTVVLTKINGQAEAYISGPNQEPAPTSSHWSTVQSGGELVTMFKTCSLLGCHKISGEGKYAILVQGGPMASETRLIFSWNDNPMTLELDSPQMQDAAFQMFEYFQFVPTIHNPSIIKTTMTGYSKLLIVYPSTTTPIPEEVLNKKCRLPDSLTWTECPGSKLKTTWLRDAEIKLTNLQTNLPVYIAVYGRSRPETVYSLVVANPAGNVTLVDGMPQSGSMEKHSSRFYRFESEGTHHKISIGANPSDGFVSLYVNFCRKTQPNGFWCRNPVPHSAEFKSVSDATGSQDEQTITITPSDGYQHTAEAGWFLITVFAEATTTYVISASTSHNPLMLQNGQSMHEKVSENKYEYFKIIQPVGLDLHVGVTTYAGDPDLYISCDLNATGTALGSPSIQHFKWKSKSSGNDVITISANQGCADGQNTVYAAVYGYKDSVFAISAIAGNDTVLELEDGRPIEWIVERFKFSQFTISTADYGTGANRPELNIEMTPQNADLDLYVLVCEKVDVMDCPAPSLTEYTYKSVKAEGSELLSIKTASSVKWVRIGVYGFQAGQFSVAAWSISPLVLMEGQAVSGTVARHHYRYFKFHVEHPADVTITLTPLTADVDLYISNVDLHPTKDIRYHRPVRHNESWWSTRSGMRVDEVTIKNAPSPYEYIIGVYGWASNASFTIQGQSSDDKLVGLDQGLPQGGEVDRGGWKYYRVMAPAHRGGKLRIVSSTSEGEIKMYANKCVGRDCLGGSNEKRPGKTPYTPPDSMCDYNSANSFNGASLSIDVAAHDADGESIAYIVGVYGVASHSEYTLTALVSGTGGHSIMTLQAGVAVSDFVLKNNYSYYRFQVMEPHKDLSIVVTPFSGDPDVYVSTQNSYPDRHTHTWSHRSLGTDILSIRENDPLVTCHPDKIAEGVCEYFISVEGYEDAATYTIMAYLHDNTPITLQRGIPQTGHVNETEGMYYTFTLNNKKENLQITLTPNDDGDPDLYVLLGQMNATNMISRVNKDYKSTNWRETETILINHASPLFKSRCPIDVNAAADWSCQINIFVYGYSTSSFDIVVASDDRPVRLRNWRALPATVEAKDVEFFEFDVDSAGYDTFVSLTSTNGDADLYVGIKCNFTHPENSVYRWRSIQSAGHIDAVEIKHTDEFACHPTKTARCRYCIEVRNWETHAVSFSITAGQDTGDNAQALPAGGQIAGQVASKQFKYYLFQKNADIEDITFAVTASVGAVDMYISREIVPGTSRVRFPIICKRPQCTNYPGSVVQGSYTWHIPNRQTQVFKLRSSMPNYCTSCNYIIGIYDSGRSEARYQISATTKRHTTQLSQGVAVPSMVTSGNYVYFRFNVANRINGYLNALVQPTGGSAELSLYVGFGAKDVPTAAVGQHDIKSENLGSECIFIALQDFCKGANLDENGECVAYFGVLAKSRGGSNGVTSFKIMAEMDNMWNNSISLSTGNPLIGCAQEQGFTYYSHLVDMNDLDRITITLAPLSLTADPDLYVSIGKDSPVTRTHWDYKDSHFSGNDMVIVQKGDPKFAAKCRSHNGQNNTRFCYVNIGVYGYKASSFVVTITRGVDETFLLPGLQVSGVVGSRQYNYYRFTSTEEDISINLDAPYGGDPDIFVSNTFDETKLPEQHDRTSYQWSQRRRGGDFLYIAHSDKSFKANSEYVIGVYGFTNVSYTLMVTLGVEPTRLLPNVQVQGQALSNSFQYYTIDRGESEKDVVVSVTPFSGSPVIYAIANSDGVFPSRSHYSQSSASARLKVRNTVIMRNGTDVRPGEDILIGVFGQNGATTYNIRAGICGDSHTLLDGHSYQNLGICSNGNMKEFDYFAPMIGNNWGMCLIEVLVSSSDSSPMIVMSQNDRTESAKRPHCSMVSGKVQCEDATWKMSVEGGKFSLIVDESDPCATAATPKPSCCDDPNTAKTSVCKSSLLGGSRSFFVGAYSVDANYGLTITRRCIGTAYAPSVVTLDPNSVDIRAQTFSYPFCPMEQRSHSTELCEPSTAATRQSSFFQFSVSASDYEDNSAVAVILKPEAPQGSQVMKKLSLYLKSCVSNHCSNINTIPGPNSRHDNLLGEMIPPDSLTFFIDGLLLCTPTKTESCTYYMGVYGDTSHDRVPFSVSISTGGQREVPVQWGRTVLAGGHEQTVCGNGKCISSLSYIIQPDTSAKYTKLRETLELCSGDVTVETCAPDAEITYDCQKNSDPGLTMKATSGDDPSQKVLVKEFNTNGKITYITAYGSGVFRLYLDRGSASTNTLKVPDVDIKSSELDGGVGVILTWQAPTLNQGRRLGSAGAAIYSAYRIYLIEAGSVEENEKAIVEKDAVLYTLCGLQKYSSTHPHSTLVLPVPSNGATEISYNAADLKPGFHYVVSVVAICDSNCQSSSGVTTDLDCDDRNNIQCSVYKNIKIETGKVPSSGLAPGIIVIIILGAFFIIALGYIGWKKKVAAEQLEQYQMRDVSDLNFGMDTLNKYVGKKSGKYESLLANDGNSEVSPGDFNGEGDDQASLITHF